MQSKADIVDFPLHRNDQDRMDHRVFDCPLQAPDDNWRGRYSVSAFSEASAIEAFLEYTPRTSTQIEAIQDSLDYRVFNCPPAGPRQGARARLPPLRPGYLDSGRLRRDALSAWLRPGGDDQCSEWD